MIQHQNLIEIEQTGYVTHEVSLRIVEREEFILSQYFFKPQRIFIGLVDIVFALLLFFTFILSIPFVWVFNRLYNPGPLFYKQPRVGKDGKLFNIIKYRSMKVNA